MTIDNVLQEIKEVNEPLEETLYNRLLPEYAKKLDAIATPVSYTHLTLPTKRIV